MIAPALQALTVHRQFIVYRLETNKTRHGKTDKIPCDYRTGQNASAHDPAIWLDADTAIQTAAARGNNFGVGFVLTANCKLFCLDIDGCLQAAENQWSPLAHQLCTMFPGAGVEISQSGRGLHIWGTYSGEMPPHGCKNTVLGIELYTSDRFIALGRPDSATGNAATDFTLQFFLPIASLSSLPIQDGARRDSTGMDHGTRFPNGVGLQMTPNCLEGARSSRSANDAFSNKASFADLWNANTDALSRAFPADGRPYDASSADAALGATIGVSGQAKTASESNG